MKVFTSEDALAWIGSNLFTWHGSELVFAGDCLRYHVSMPETYGRVVVLADLLLRETLDGEWPGGFLWVRAYDIWSEVATIHIYNRLRDAVLGERKDLSDCPGQEFEGAEYDDAYSFFLLACLGGWDAIWITRNRDRIINLSHDGLVHLIVPIDDSLSQFEASVRSYGFDFTVGNVYDDNGSN
jgi:hypothetical protein